MLAFLSSSVCYEAHQVGSFNRLPVTGAYSPRQPSQIKILMPTYTQLNVTPLSNDTKDFSGRVIKISTSSGRQGPSQLCNKIYDIIF